MSHSKLNILANHIPRSKQHLESVSLGLRFQCYLERMVCIPFWIFWPYYRTLQEWIQDLCWFYVSAYHTFSHHRLVNHPWIFQSQHKQQIFAFLEHTMSIRNLGSMMHSGGVINHHIQYQKCILDHGYLAKQCQSVSRDEMVPKEHCKVQQHHKEPKCFSHIWLI